jgi:hypothetical protein
MEGLEAETLVGSNIGYKVTTTANQVTTESIEFLESGIIDGALGDSELEMEEAFDGGKATPKRVQTDP